LARDSSPITSMSFSHCNKNRLIFVMESAMLKTYSQILFQVDAKRAPTGQFRKCGASIVHPLPAPRFYYSVNFQP
jgi:hypothetical protein